MNHKSTINTTEKANKSYTQYIIIFYVQLLYNIYYVL